MSRRHGSRASRWKIDTPAPTTGSGRRYRATRWSPWTAIRSVRIESGYMQIRSAPAELAGDEAGDLGEEEAAAGCDRGDDERGPELVPPERPSAAPRAGRRIPAKGGELAMRIRRPADHLARNAECGEHDDPFRASSGRLEDRGSPCSRSGSATAGRAPSAVEPDEARRSDITAEARAGSRPGRLRAAAAARARSPSARSARSCSGRQPRRARASALASERRAGAGSGFANFAVDLAGLPPP